MFRRPPGGGRHQAAPFDGGRYLVTSINHLHHKSPVPLSGLAGFCDSFPSPYNADQAPTKFHYGGQGSIRNSLPGL